MKIKFILILFLISYPFVSNSQISVESIVTRINSADYIFEGEVIRSDGYWATDKDYIYTSATIDIKKIFKGTLQCGKVELITDGGQVGDSVEIQISHNLNLAKGMKGV